ncbi:MAG: DNA sulfur modification protein DndD [Solirubrobacteraceae bacterium]
MIISRLELRNWGPYAGDHRIEFAEPSDKRAIQLILGENGHGKTHLLRAMVIALHGRDGMRIVDPESRPIGASLKKWLDVFLTDVLTNGHEADEAPQVRLAIELIDGQDTIEVQRSWWFDERKPSDEELVVILNGAPYEPKTTGSDEQYDEKQALVQARIPENVVQFFFFDGEEIKTIAENDPNEEVTRGLDALLGFTLMEDLRKDVESARSELSKEEVAGKRAAAEIRRLEAEISELEANEEELVNQIAEDRDRAALLTGQIDELQRRLPSGTSDASDGDGHRADIATRIQDRERERDNIRRRLGESVASNLAVGYPAAMLNETIERLDGERALREWEQQRILMAPECQKLSERMYGKEAPKSDPPLTGSQLRFYRDILVQEWKNILQPPPAGIPDEEWFSAFSPEQLNEARTRLERATTAAADDITTTIREDAAISEEIRHLHDRLDNYATDQAMRALVDEIKDASDRLGQTKGSISEREAELGELRDQLAEKRREHTTKVTQSAGSAETRERLSVANDILAVVSQFRDQLKRQRVLDLQEHIGRMMVSLSHKGEDQFNAITVDPSDFRLSIRDRDGNEVRNASAGEREILALSMLWALGSISRRALPLVIDTPLGRLDRRHRQNIVDHFLPNAAEQVIVLATDEEITDERRRRLADRIAGELELTFDPATLTTSIVSLAPLS